VNGGKEHIDFMLM